MPSPLAGKPPFATDEPDSFYESPPAPQHRVRQQPPPYPNKRTSAYDVYDNYLGDKAANHQSGVGALGMGLLNMDDDDDDDDDNPTHRMPQPQAPTTPGTPTSKHMALAAATSTANSPRSPPPQYIAAPRPGYAAPIAALNLARPEAAAFPQDRKQLPAALRVGENPFDPKNPFHGSLPSPRVLYHPMPSPSPSMTEPHPLQPPITPITPVFARPSQPGITFSETAAVPRPRKPIMRSDTEGTLLPNRGEKGDDFWRRFSMVVKVEKGQKESSWLKKTQNGSTRLSRWVWVTGIFLLICIGGAIGLGVYVSQRAPSHQQPKVFGGSASESSGPSSSQPTSTAASAGAISLHVQPTFTVARRVLEPSASPALQNWANAVHKHKKRMHKH